MHMIDDLI